MIARRLLIPPVILCAPGFAPLGMAQTVGRSAAVTGHTTMPSNDDKTVNDLPAAAQRLREAIQAMAQAPAGPRCATCPSHQKELP
jgi:hypothetical protein